MVDATFQSLSSSPVLRSRTQLTPRQESGDDEPG